MTEVYIGLGSNIEPEKYTPLALERLRQCLDVVSVSSFYCSSAVGTAVGQADFINGVVKVKTSLSAEQLKFEVLRPIEYEFGRRLYMPKHAPRTMDLDLLIFGDEVIEELNIPEADILRRPFVYIPLLEIAPDIEVKGFDGPVKNLVNFQHNMKVWSFPACDDLGISAPARSAG